MVVGCDRKPAYTSIIRAASLRASGDRDVPLRDVRVMPRQLRAGGQYAELLLPGEHPLPVGVPAVVELAGVAVGPLLGHMMRACPAPVQKRR